jgi:hypothetical protein
MSNHYADAGAVACTTTKPSHLVPRARSPVAQVVLATICRVLVVNRHVAAVLLHRRAGSTRGIERLGTGAAVEISVTTNRHQARGASGEVMISDTVPVVGRGTIASHARLMASGVEGRGDRAAVRCKTFIVRVRGLPVDGLHTVLKLGRRTELPLADNGPDESNTTDAASDGSDDSQADFAGLGE